MSFFTLTPKTAKRKRNIDIWECALSYFIMLTQIVFHHLFLWNERVESFCDYAWSLVWLAVHRALLCTGSVDI
jgi:hypothetical protein